MIRFTSPTTIKMNEKISVGHRDSKTYSVSLKNVLKVMSAFDEKWKQMQDGDRPDSLNLLLYGAPGTGKTEFAKHVARTLDRKLIIKRTSDLLNCYVGETEKAIRKMFKDAVPR